MPASDGLGGHKGEPWKLGKKGTNSPVPTKKMSEISRTAYQSRNFCDLPCRIRISQEFAL